MPDLNPSSNGLQPTPASRILALMTRVVKAPRLSELAGEDVCLRVRMATAEEVLEATETEETRGMIQEEVQAYMAQLPPAERAAMNKRADDKLETFLAAIILDPKIGEAEGQIPYTAVRADRYALFRAVLDLSGFGESFRDNPPGEPGAAGRDGATVGAPADRDPGVESL